MKRKDTDAFERNRRERQSWLHALPSAATRDRGGRESEREKKKKGKKMAGKAMYKISTINTIFIIDMLQNKVPSQVFHGKVLDETVFIPYVSDKE